MEVAMQERTESRPPHEGRARPTVDAYRDAMHAIIARVEDNAGADTACPACPGWTVRDVVAHVCHLAADAAAGSFPTAVMQEAVGARAAAARAAAAQDRDRYLEAGVQERRSWTWADLVASWEQACETAGDRLEPVTGDAVLHLLDIDAALGFMADEAPHVLAAGVRAAHEVQRTHFRAVGVPPVRWRAYDLELELGTPEQVQPVTGASSWLLRAAAGRVTRHDADRHLDWGQTQEPTRAAFALYGGWRSP
jgi:uncharacterized protein (TIGR03083 family)